MTVASQMMVTVMVSGRKRRTCIGCTNFQLVSWVSDSSTHTTPVTHGPASSRYRVGTIMFHSHGKPLKKWSSVIWSVRDIHSADMNSTNAPMTSDQPSGSMPNWCMNTHGDDDAGDEVDDQVERVAVDAGHVLLHAPGTSDRAVDAVEDHRDGQPQDGLLGLAVGDGDEAEHAAHRAERGERSGRSSPSPPGGGVHTGCGIGWTSWWWGRPPADRQPFMLTPISR